MKNNLDTLISGLTADLKPGRPLSQPWLASAVVLATLAWLALLIFGLFEPRDDLRALLTSSLMGGLLLMPTLLVGFAIALILRGALVGYETAGIRSPTWLTGLGFVSYVGLAWAYSHGAVAPGATSLYMEEQDLKCAMLIFVLSLPYWAALDLASAWLHPHSQAFALGTGVIGLAAGLLIVNVHCPYDGHGHHLFGHALIPLAMSVVAYFPLAWTSGRIRAGLIGWRTHRALKRTSSL